MNTARLWIGRPRNAKERNWGQSCNTAELFTFAVCVAVLQL